MELALISDACVWMAMADDVVSPDEWPYSTAAEPPASKL
jgi:hypothetical protein